MPLTPVAYVFFVITLCYYGAYTLWLIPAMAWDLAHECLGPPKWAWPAILVGLLPLLGLFIAGVFKW